MAKIKKIIENGGIQYPATITDAVKNPNNGKTVTEELSELGSYIPLVITKGENNPVMGSVYYLSHVRLIKDHTYRFDIESPAGVEGLQLSLKIANPDGTTYKTIEGNLLTDGVWDGSKKSRNFTATEDKYDMFVGSYGEGIDTPSVVICSITDITADNFGSELKSVETIVKTIGEATPINGSVYYLSHVRLIKNHIYRVDIQSPSGVQGTQMSLKLANADGTTYKALEGNLLTNGVWDGSKKSRTYTATEDKYDMLIGSYYEGINKASNVICSLTDITIDEISNKINPEISEIKEELNRIDTIINQKGDYELVGINAYGIVGINLLQGHSYRVDIEATGIVQGTQVSLKLANEDGSTLKTLIGNLLTNGTWDGSIKSKTYYADKDYDNVKIGSYIEGVTQSSLITIKVVDISLASRTLQDSYNIVDYYNQHHKELSNIENTSDLNIVFFSDVHGTSYYSKNVSRIVDFVNSRVNINVVINGGDTINDMIVPSSTAGDNYLSDLDWYDAIVNNCQADVLTCVGNHDAWIGPYQAGVFNWAPLTDVFKLVTKKVVTTGSHNGSPIMLPNNAESEGKCYFYKDYADVRIVVLNSTEHSTQPSNYWDAKQIEWFEDVLTSAINLGKSVICVAHCPSDLRDAKRIKSNWTSCKDQSWGGYDAIQTPKSAFDIVNTFMSNGGKFVCWLNGHTHYDQLLMPNDVQKQLEINIATARYNYHTDGYAAQSENEPSYDCFNYIGIDTQHHFIKVYRCGWDMDMSMRVRKALCYDYLNHEIIVD